MIEVVFGESSGGAIKIAKKYKNSSQPAASAIGFIGKQPTKEEYEEFQLDIAEMRKGEPIGGDSSEVVCLPFMFDIGDIKEPVCSDLRKEIICRMYSAADGEFKDSDFYSVFEEYKNELGKLKNFAESGAEFRIWYSDAPYSMCGFYFVCDFLKNYKCKISAIKMPLYVTEYFKNTHRITSWGEVDPSKFYKFLPFEKELSDAEINYISEVWNKLREENNPLRVLISGIVVGADENFYDDIIRKEIIKLQPEFSIGKLIGKILNKYSFGIGDFWYASRIKKMIENGELKLINDKEDYFYGHIVQTVIKN